MDHESAGILAWIGEAVVNVGALSAPRRGRGGTPAANRPSSGGEIAHVDRIAPIELIRGGEIGVSALARAPCPNDRADAFAV
jgi:hypothetical protein